jgi:hypothetical protein
VNRFVLALLVVVAGCATDTGVDTSSNSVGQIPASSTSIESSTVPDTVVLTSTSTSSTTTTTAPDPYALWGEAVAGSPLSVGPSSAGMLLYGVRSDGRYVELMEWNESAWEASYELDFNVTPERIDSLWLTDLTGDGVDDIVASYWIGQDVFGEVFVPDGTRFRSVPIDSGWAMPQGMLSNPTLTGGTLVGLGEPCEPSCAEGPVLAVPFRWDGSRMVGGNPRCDGLRPIDYGEPVAMCTSGEFVRRVQEALNYFGYMSDSADGQFGPLTRQGVVRYQQDVGLWTSGWLEGGDAYGLIEYYNDSLYWGD